MTSLLDAKVLITGASGFLGTHLVQRLCPISGEVHATSRTQRPTLKGGPLWWQTNLEDLGAVRSLFETVKPDIIFHMSGLASAIQTVEFVLPTFHSLLTSTVNLLTVATEVGCQRVVLAGSLNEPQSEDPEMIPSSPYAAAKWAGSAYGRMFHALYGTPLVIVRTFMTYGPGQDSRKLIPSVVLSLLQGESPKLSSGQWNADWIYINDVIDGFLAAAQMPQIEGAMFDLGSGALVTVRELVEKLVKIVGCSTRPLFGALPDRAFEPARKAEIRKTFEKLGWNPKVSLESGLQQTVEWYRAQCRSSSLSPHQK
ncbi:MAG: NAD-dependent epimerase/dehydratase family protein [Nitrospiraceae bacterium]|nr:NAD-dependent epimerase/dehydratase family protein [Nitrospira sp.]MCB9775544.1 NAD-dependent epimerase/dehydratase family protein [Nitrospiraceae bacterium]